MSWTFLRRELRRQTPAGIGLVALGGLLLLSTLALTHGGYLDVLAGLVCLLTPALLGVHAFGPDLEQGQERFLTVLPMSRARVGLMRLGVAVGVTLAVDGVLLALLLGLSGPLAASRMAGLLWVIRLSLLLLPLGAVAAVSLRHTLAALAAVVASLIVAPVALEALDDYDLALDGAMLLTVLGSMGGTSLWLYARARTKRPLRVALSTGALAVLIGFSPVPAYGGVRAVATEASDLWNRRADLWERYDEWRHGRPEGLSAGPEPDVFTVFGTYDGGTTIGISSPDGKPPLQVASGAELDWTWQGNWLLTFDSTTRTLTQLDWETRTVRVHALPTLPPPSEAIETEFALIAFGPQRLWGLHVDRVADDLWVAPPAPLSGTTVGYGPGGWADGSHDALNLTRGEAWTPPRGWEIASLAQGWACLVDRKGGARVIHITRGTELDLGTLVPDPLQTPHMEILRTGDTARLVGLRRGAPSTLWHLDLAAPNSLQATTVPDLNLEGAINGAVALTSANGSQLWVHLDTLWSQTETGSIPADAELLLWSLTEPAFTPLTDCWPLCDGPRGESLIRDSRGELVLLRPGRPPLEFAPLPRGHRGYHVLGDGSVLSLDSDGNALVSRSDGTWEPAERTIGLPSSWDVLEPSAIGR